MAETDTQDAPRATQWEPPPPNNGRSGPVPMSSVMQQVLGQLLPSMLQGLAGVLEQGGVGWNTPIAIQRQNPDTGVMETITKPAAQLFFDQTNLIIEGHSQLTAAIDANTKCALIQMRKSWRDLDNFPDPDDEDDEDDEGEFETKPKRRVKARR